MNGFLQPCHQCRCRSCKTGSIQKGKNLRDYRGYRPRRFTHISRGEKMIGQYGKVEETEDGYFDCKGLSRYVFFVPCTAKETAQKAADRATRLTRTLRTIAIVFGIGLLGSATFLGFTALRQRAMRRNPKKKQSIGNRLARILGGTVLMGLGATGYTGPQLLEPISTVIGGGMSLGGLYLLGSGVVGKQNYPSRVQ